MTFTTYERAQRNAAIIREIEKAGWRISTTFAHGNHLITLRRAPTTIRWSHPDRLDWDGAYELWKETN